MKMAKLKNGDELPMVIALEVTEALNELFDKEIFVFLDLVKLCRDETEDISERSQKHLTTLGFISHTGDFKGKTWVVSDAVRSVILSGVSGEGMKLTFVWPFKK